MLMGLKLKNVFLARLVKLYHKNETPVFKFLIVKTCRSAMERQIREGVLIRRTEEQKSVILMKSKLDHYAPAVGRVVITRAVKE